MILRTSFKRWHLKGRSSQGFLASLKNDSPCGAFEGKHRTTSQLRGKKKLVEDAYKSMQNFGDQLPKRGVGSSMTLNSMVGYGGG